MAAAKKSRKPPLEIPIIYFHVCSEFPAAGGCLSAGWLTEAEVGFDVLGDGGCKGPAGMEEELFLLGTAGNDPLLVLLG